MEEHRAPDIGMKGKQFGLVIDPSPGLLKQNHLAPDPTHNHEQ